MSLIGQVSSDVTSRQRAVRMIHASVDGTGTAALNFGSQEVSLTDNGTGDYTLTISEPFASTRMCVVATSRTADVVIQHDPTSLSASRVDIKCFDSTDGTTAKDADFDVIIVGSDAADER